MKLKPVDLKLLDRLYSLVGQALWHGNDVENAIAHFITVALKLPPSRAENEVKKVLDEMQSKTLGQLIVELRKANSSDSVSQFERRIKAFLQERNWLVHDSGRQHGNDIYKPELLPPLFARLEKFADEASSLQRFFVDLIEAWVLKQPGITPRR